jgi:hypothetical protein
MLTNLSHVVILSAAKDLTQTPLILLRYMMAKTASVRSLARPPPDSG